MDLSDFLQQATDGPPPDLSVELHLSPQELDDGCIKHVDIDRSTPCDACDGAPCDACDGTGHTSQTEQRGMFVVHRTCDACVGGVRYPADCTACHGTGFVGHTERVEVAIPRDAEAGDIIRIPGKGMPGRGEHPASDLHVTVVVDTAVPLAIVRESGRSIVGFGLVFALAIAIAIALRYLL